MDKDTTTQLSSPYLIGVQEEGMTLGDALEHVNELSELVRCIGLAEKGRTMTLLKTPSPRYLLGSGKAEEVVATAKEVGADCLVFDGELSPSQQRNWEQLAGMPVADRQEIILDIFAQRAQTKEAVIQVELARLQYQLPRLTRAWTHLSRQRGGVTGARGEGEKQIELDRRLVLQKVQSLRKELTAVRSQRDTQRKGRERRVIPHAAIVGYTNAGKSSLLNRLTDSEVFVEDQVFATLDPTTRKFLLPNGQSMLLTDTVGFVRRLPHLLVEAFKSTLEEAVLADFLILVLDASSHQVDEHWETTLSVLHELGARDKEMVVCFNKIDVQKDSVVLARLRATHPDAYFISVRSREGLDALVARLVNEVRAHSAVEYLRVPPSRPDILAMLHKSGAVSDLAYDDDGTACVTVYLSDALRARVQPWIVSA